MFVLNQINITKVKLESFDKIIAVDIEVIGNDSRRKYIKKAVEEERCLVALHRGKIVGFLIFDTNFFDNSFISLIIVSPNERRKGCATALIEFFVDASPTLKIFSSTNQSNVEMQKVFNSNGFVRSEIVENLDEGDSEIIYYKTKGTKNY